jgi:hypothetical protein
MNIELDELQDMDLFADELDERFNAGTISSASSSSSASSATSCASCGCCFSCLCSYSFADEVSA